MTNLEMSNLLKQSLSKTLTIFYPLDGYINNYTYADCNDRGVLFVETKANCELSYILQNRNQYHIYTKKLIPVQPEKGIHQYVSLFQITYFKCGGVAVSFAMPHMLGDGVSDLTFLTSWAAIARGNTVDNPSFDSASIFPPETTPRFDLSELVPKENVVTKSFVFDASTLSSLRDKYSSDDEKFTRVQALCTFIFTRIMVSIGKKNRFIVFNQVNLRPLLDVPNSKNLFGNIVTSATAVIDIGKKNEIPRRIQDSFTKVNANHVKELQGGLESISVNETYSSDWLKGDMDKYIFSSLCNFPLYDIDFGWGMPEWVTGSGMAFENLILFSDTKEGQGIEAWINLAEENMAKFEKDEVLLSHLSSIHNGNPNFISRL